MMNCGFRGPGILVNQLNKNNYLFLSSDVRVTCVADLRWIWLIFDMDRVWWVQIGRPWLSPHLRQHSRKLQMRMQDRIRVEQWWEAMRRWAVLDKSLTTLHVTSPWHLTMASVHDISLYDTSPLQFSVTSVHGITLWHQSITSLHYITPWHQPMTSLRLHDPTPWHHAMTSVHDITLYDISPWHQSMTSPYMTSVHDISPWHHSMPTLHDINPWQQSIIKTLSMTPVHVINQSDLHLDWITSSQLSIFW